MLLTALVGATNAQTTFPKIPVYEVFSSSTCPPCRPANEHLSPIFEQYQGQIAVVKYQMNWPGTGDPYYTAEGSSRKSYYGVTGVPAFFRASVETSYSAFTAASVEEDFLETTSMKIELRYLIDTINHTVRVRARAEAFADYTDAAHRVMIPIIEHITYRNKKSNGETEFHNVFKKMLPAQTGQLIIGTIAQGTVLEYDTTYTFKGNYRLPNNSSDQIDNNTEHSVENFDNLHVIMMVQSMTSKEVYQGGIGERSYDEANLTRAWGTEPLAVNEIAVKEALKIYPNPASTSITVSSASNTISKIEIIDIQGRVVLSETALSAPKVQVNISDLAAGSYILKAHTAAGIETEKLVIK